MGALRRGLIGAGIMDASTGVLSMWETGRVPVCSVGCLLAESGLDILTCSSRFSTAGVYGGVSAFIRAC